MFLFTVFLNECKQVPPKEINCDNYKKAFSENKKKQKAKLSESASKKEEWKMPLITAKVIDQKLINANGKNSLCEAVHCWVWCVARARKVLIKQRHTQVDRGNNQFNWLNKYWRM